MADESIFESGYLHSKCERDATLDVDLATKSHAVKHM